MYSKTKVCVSIGDTHSNFFKSEIGVRQGDVLTLNFFKIFVNDLPSYLSEYSDPVNVNGNHLQCLIYANDGVLVSVCSRDLMDYTDRAKTGV